MVDLNSGWQNPKANLLEMLQQENDKRTRKGQKQNYIPSALMKPPPPHYIHDGKFFCPSQACAEFCIQDREIIQRQLKEAQMETIAMESRARAAEAEEYKLEVLNYADQTLKMQQMIARLTSRKCHLEDTLRDRMQEMSNLKDLSREMQAELNAYEMAFRQKKPSVDIWKRDGVVYEDSKSSIEAVNERIGSGPMPGMFCSKVSVHVKEEEK